MSLNKYPQKVQARVRVIETSTYEGFCRWNGYVAEVSSGTFAHEMGHATAHILGIENELAELVWEHPGSEVVTNDNIFCYGAQQRAKGNIDHAKAEYAADAIQAYTEGWPELPIHIKEYLDAIWTA